MLYARFLHEKIRSLLAKSHLFSFKMIQKISFFGLILFSYFPVFSQVVNIENARIYDDTAGWSGEVTGLFSAQQNKDLLVSMNFRPRAQFKTRKQSIFFIGDYNFSKGKDRVYANSGMFHFRYAYRIKQSGWKWEGYTQIQYNELLDQRYRFLVGGGIRSKFYDKKGWKFFAGTSTFYEQEQIVSTNQIVEDVRWSNYLSWFIDPKTFFTFTGATYYQPLWEDFKDYRILGQYTLRFKITKAFSVSTNLNFFHDERPPTNVRKTVYNTSVGFSYNFR